MVFMIEEVNEKEAIQSYQSSCMYHMLLVYYYSVNKREVKKVDHVKIKHDKEVLDQELVELIDPVACWEHALNIWRKSNKLSKAYVEHKS